MTTPPAIVQPSVPGVKQTQAVRPTASFGRQGAGARPLTPTTQTVTRSMKSPSFMSTSKLSAPIKAAADTVSKAVLPNVAKAAAPALGAAARTISGPAGLAMAAAAPYASKAMQQSYKQGHSSFVQHPTTPGVKASDSFARMRQMSTSAATPTPKAEPSSFKQAFAAARKEAGSSQGQFTYKGKQYQTNLNPAKGAEKYIPASQQKATSVGKTSTASDTGTSTTTPGSTSIKAQPAPPSSATAGMSSAAEKSGISQTPTKSGTEFGAGKDVSSTPMPTTSTPPARPADLDKTTAPSAPAASASVPTPPSRPADLGSSESKPMQNPDQERTKAKTVSESFVSVGDYKYRIV